tara:strand:- start:839 stop:1498 length:660 start_codon:yes stop_codon:yes gene_type:complete
MKKSKFIEILKKLIEREKMKEASTSANVPGYMTPRAFSGKGSKDGVPLDRRNSIASGSGYQKVNEVKIGRYDIGMGSKGNGITLWNRNVEKAGDYKSIAHIATNGKITNYEKRQPKEVTAFIQKIAQGMKDKPKSESVNEGKYHDYRNDESLTPRQKIGHSMREVRNALSELNKMIDMNVRLKNELNVDSRSYWKNTHKALGKISERLVKLANKVGKLQ